MKTYTDEEWIRGIMFGSVGFIVLLIIMIAPFGNGTRPAAPSAGSIGLPTYPNRTIITQSTTADRAMIQFTTPDPPATILAWYRTELEKRHWFINHADSASLPTIQHYSQTFTCHHFLLTISINPERHEVTQTLVYRGEEHGSLLCK